MSKKQTFESALERLEQIAASLDRGDAPLDESLKLYKEGAELIALCSGKLKEAKLTVEKLFPLNPLEDGNE